MGVGWRHVAHHPHCQTPNEPTCQHQTTRPGLCHNPQANQQHHSSPLPAAAEQQQRFTSTVVVVIVITINTSRHSIAAKVPITLNVILIIMNTTITTNTLCITNSIAADHLEQDCVGVDVADWDVQALSDGVDHKPEAARHQEHGLPKSLQPLH